MFYILSMTQKCTYSSHDIKLYSLTHYKCQDITAFSWPSQNKIYIFKGKLLLEIQDFFENRQSKFSHIQRSHLSLTHCKTEIRTSHLALCLTCSYSTKLRQRQNFDTSIIVDSFLNVISLCLTNSLYILVYIKELAIYNYNVSFFNICSLTLQLYLQKNIKQNSTQLGCRLFTLEIK